MASKNVETAQAQVEAFNRRDLDAQVSGYAEEFTMTDHARGITLTPREEIRAWMAELIAASSDSKVSIERVFDAGDGVISVLRMDGTNDGPMGPMPATGRRFSVRGVEILRFDERGRIVAHDNFFDQLSVLTQLGFAQPPPRP